jgi:hypothetical protein
VAVDPEESLTRQREVAMPRPQNLEWWVRLLKNLEVAIKPAHKERQPTFQLQYRQFLERLWGAKTPFVS